MKSVSVYAPGSIGNVGPGLDILGLAVGGAGDVVTARVAAGRGIVVRASGHPTLSDDPTRHASALAAAAVMRRAKRRVGLELWIRKGLPLSGGQGGSAASAVAGAVAANLVLGSPLGTIGILEAALASETELAGRHLDNIAPALLGGLVLIRGMDPIDVVQLPTPKGLWIALVKPGYELQTRRGRSVLPAKIPRATALHQAAQVAAMVAGALQGDAQLFGRAIDDRIAEPARSRLLPGFAAAKKAALSAGALGCSISGSGPTLFAVAGTEAGAGRIARAVAKSYRESGFGCSARIALVDRTGARQVAGRR